MDWSEFQTQLQSCREQAGYLDISGRTQIELTGGDAEKFLQNFTTQDIAHVDGVRGVETFLCDVRGKTIGHGYVHREGSWILESVPEQAEKLIAHLDRYLIAEDVELHDRTNDWGLIALLGEEAESKLKQLQPLTDAVNMAVRATPMYGVPAFHLRCDAAQQPQVIKALEGCGCIAVEAEVCETLRIAAGTPCFGQDINEKNLPQELVRDQQAISFEKGCYLGQETVARLDASGSIRWQLKGVSGPAELQTGMELRVAGSRVGETRSCARSPDAADQSIGLALVQRDRSDTGTELESDVGPVRIIQLPE